MPRSFFSQLSNCDGTKPRGYAPVVPEAPTFSGIPDIDVLLGGDNSDSTLLDVQPSQWLPSTQTHGVYTPVSRNENPLDATQVSEKGDGIDVNLGSQFPLIHSIGASQLPIDPPWRCNSNKNNAGDAPPSQYRNSPQDRRPRALPQRKLSIYGDRLSLLSQGITNNSQVPTSTRQTPGLPRQAPTSNSHTPSIQRQVPTFNRQRHAADRQVPVSNRQVTALNRPLPASDRQHYVPPNNIQTSVHTEQHLDGEADLFTDDHVSQTPTVLYPSSTGDRQDELYTPSVVPAQQMVQYQGGVRLRSVTEIAQKYHQLFRFPHFNMVQSKVFDDVIYTDKSLVLCSPTGSGKTAVFEMAIVRLLSTQNSQNLKVVYMAPIKALCSERYSDWKEKFEPFNLKVMELTGDTENDDFYELQKVNIILTTPEKWDSMTRKWRDNKAVMQLICLFLVDEIHVLNDPNRGAVVEAVISRMKTIQAARQRTVTDKQLPALRFAALSATITNIEDIAHWLGTDRSPALHFKFDESARPVRLRKVVLGYHFSEGKRSEFQFDISLSYKLAGIINAYNDNKPTLIFCATRKGVMQAADILAKDVKSSYLKNAQHRLNLQNHSFHLKDTKLRDLVSLGIGYHHAGMDIQDRKHIEDVFANGELPVLVATSTLAMGVNLPAHLVIIKSTMYYNMGSLQEYADTQVLQMIGRAGRPQFDTNATAVIMTKNTTKAKYENLINGTQLIESSLHKNLVEHLNAEIVLNTITDISVAVEWLKFTFLYIRVMKNPVHYGIPCGLAKVAIDRRLQDLCMKSLNQLNCLKLIDMNGSNLDVKSTDSGRLMARYCISFKTAELFLGLKGDESISDLINIISKCEEFEDIKLRVNEKTSLNTLNKDKNRITIRYPMNGKIKTTDMKVNCLIQATLGCLLIHDFALQQDTTRIFKAGIRVTRCLVELVSQKKNYKLMLNASLLCKCFKAKLWENSKYVSKQLDGIGPTLSTALVNAGLTTFEKMEQTNPREIELMVNRHPPFGNQVRDSISKLPKYELTIEQISKYGIDKAEIVLTITLTNRDHLKEVGSNTHACMLLVGDADNMVVHRQRIMDVVLIRDSSWTKKLEVKLATKGPLLNIHYISQDFVGLDVECTYTPFYQPGFNLASSSMSGPRQQNLPVQQQMETSMENGRQPCNHSCHNKMLCGHDCCKNGVASKRKKPPTASTPRPMMSKDLARYMEDIRQKASSLPDIPLMNKRPRIQDSRIFKPADLSRYNYMYHPRGKNPNMYGMYTDQPINVEDYQDTTEITEDYDTTDENNQTGHTPYNMKHHEPAGQQIANQNSDTMRNNSDTESVAEPSKPNYGEPSKPNYGDWDNLEMYIKNRRNTVPTEEEDDLENTDNDLPDLPDQYADNGLQPGESEDFAQETDYGIVYVHGGDQNVQELNDDLIQGDQEKTSNRQFNQEPKPAEHSSKLKPSRNKRPLYKESTTLFDEQVDVSNNNKAQIQDMYGQRDMSYNRQGQMKDRYGGQNKPDPSKDYMQPLYDQPSNKLHGRHVVSNNRNGQEQEVYSRQNTADRSQGQIQEGFQNMPERSQCGTQEIGGQFDIEYEIEDFSDESFEAAQRSEADVAINSWQDNENTEFVNNSRQQQRRTNPSFTNNSSQPGPANSAIGNNSWQGQGECYGQMNTNYGQNKIGRYHDDSTDDFDYEGPLTAKPLMMDPGQSKTTLANGNTSRMPEPMYGYGRSRQLQPSYNQKQDQYPNQEYHFQRNPNQLSSNQELILNQGNPNQGPLNSLCNKNLNRTHTTGLRGATSEQPSRFVNPYRNPCSNKQFGNYDMNNYAEYGNIQMTQDLLPTQGNFQPTQVDNSENIDPNSKWMNYFDSQSSTASDCVNTKYPSMNANNELVMRDCNGKPGYQTSIVSKSGRYPNYNRHDDGNKMTTAALNLPSNKYGQPLTSLSNQSNIGNSASGINNTMDSKPRSPMGYPDFSIFDDIL